MSRPSDERRTPRWFFEACDRLWGPYELDCFAARWNHQTARFITKEQDFYRWRGRARRAWVQPPYSRGQLDRALGHVRQLVLERRLQAASCLVPVDPSTDWWKTHIARPQGAKLRVEWLTGELGVPFVEAYRLVSDHLAVTIALPDVRVAFDPPPGTPPRELEKFHGAKQPSVVVTFERNCNPVASGRRLSA